MSGVMKVRLNEDWPPGRIPQVILYLLNPPTTPLVLLTNPSRLLSVLSSSFVVPLLEEFSLLFPNIGPRLRYHPFGHLDTHRQTDR